MRSIRVIDLETTGEAPPEHGVVEAGWCDVTPGGLNLACEPTGWTVGEPRAVLINPGRPVPPEAAAIHHLMDADLAGAESWAEFSSFFDPALCEAYGVSEMPDAYAAHGAASDRAFVNDALTGGRPWICTYKCALRLWPDAPNFKNQTLRYWRAPAGLDRALASPAHRGGPDAYVTAHLLRDMLELVPVEQLIEWSGQPGLLPRITFGDLRGRPWSDADDGLLYWVLGKNFNEDVMFTVRHELERRERAAREGETP